MSSKWKPLQVGDPVQVFYGGRPYSGEVTTVIKGGAEVYIKFVNDKGETMVIWRPAREVKAAA